MIREVDDAYMSERAAIGDDGHASKSTLKDGDGGGKLPPMQKDDGLKSRVDTLQVFMVVFLAGLIALAAGVLASVNGTNTRIDAMQKATSELNREVGVVGQKVDSGNDRLSRIEQQLQSIDSKLK